MKILVLNGSPKKKSDTFRMTEKGEIHEDIGIERKPKEKE